MERRARRFSVGVAVAWFVLPLAGGLIGLFCGYRGAVLPFVQGDYAQILALGVLGAIGGAAIATVHTVWSYWNLYLR